jgi:formate--tetrahydrofolate ligase
VNVGGALRQPSGGPKVVAGIALDPAYTKEDLKLLEAGVSNMVHHINTIRKSGMNPVVCINCFHTDTKAEIAMVRKYAEEAGARCAVSEHWAKGGEGAIELAEAVKEACEAKPKFDFLYPMETKLRQRVEKVAKTVYGASGVAWTPDAEAKAKMLEADPQYDSYATMMVKTHLSLSHDPAVKGVPKGWTLPIRDVLIYSGAKFLCPCAGTISLMPGTSSDPALRRVDVDVKTGKVEGLF